MSDGQTLSVDLAAVFFPVDVGGQGEWCQKSPASVNRSAPLGSQNMGPRLKVRPLVIGIQNMDSETSS